MILVECSVFHEFFYWAWCVFDVPNWLTLVVEVGVAGFLAILFYKLSSRYYIEMKKGKAEKRVSAIRIIGFFTLILHSKCENLDNHITDLLSKNILSMGEDELKLLDEGNTHLLNQITDAVNLYSDSLEADEMEYVQGLVVSFDKLGYGEFIGVKQNLNSINEIMTGLAEKLDYTPLKEALGLIKTEEKRAIKRE